MPIGTLGSRELRDPEGRVSLAPWRCSLPDDLVRIVVDVPDSATYRLWMKAFIARWKDRLKQLERWLISYRIEIE